MSTQVTVSQHQSISANESMLSRDDVGQLAKSIILRNHVKHSIRKNNSQQIITGVEIIDLQTDQTIVGHHKNTPHFAASINKLPVAWLVLQDLRNGILDLEQVLTWQASDVRAGFGQFDQPGAPLQATVGDLLYDMLHPSGNTAVRVLVNYGLGGAAAVNARLATVPDIPHTRLQPLDANRFYVGNTTAKESVWILEQLMATNDSYKVFIKNALATNPFNDISVRSQLAGNDYVVLVNKVGLLDDVEGNNRHDVGIVYNTRTYKSYGYSLMTTSPFESTTATPRAEESLEEMGRSLLRFSGDKKAQKLPDAQTYLRQQNIEQGRVLY
ncbi:MAG TPA: serine hydrolase [Candidatus Saccharimonadales bacterium]|nr:serine hydrolase [Candidatus Saccharimonadales bacterium]